IFGFVGITGFRKIDKEDRDVVAEAAALCGKVKYEPTFLDPWGSVTPLVGLGKSSLLNKTIFHLMPCAEHKLTICTPYFNLPAVL
ncbi:hypothetical protein MJM04_34935, partial [Salmonella enterica subsp. enterica serovar Cerro]|nr:hypothetical protein [Salmonella enterica subsp. enterica serovar Cerro]